MNKISARVIVPSTTQVEEIPFLNPNELYVHGEEPARVADALAELGILEDCLVGLEACDVPPGAPCRKPMGLVPLRVCEDGFVRGAWQVNDDLNRICIVDDHGKLDLMRPNSRLVARLSDVLDEWDEIDSHLGDIRCPK